MNKEKYRAVQVYFPHGWKPMTREIIGDGIERWHEIETSPVHKTPLEAIRWAVDIWENP